jgi:hypothetical protein
MPTCNTLLKSITPHVTNVCTRDLQAIAARPSHCRQEHRGALPTAMPPQQLAAVVCKPETVIRQRCIKTILRSQKEMDIW